MRSAHECPAVTATDLKVPPGTAAEPPPQQAMVPSARTMQVWPKPTARVGRSPVAGAASWDSKYLIARLMKTAISAREVSRLGQ